MAWQDRDYNQSNYSGGGYLGNPLSALNISVPFGTWFGARVRLHFWLLLSILFIVVDGLRSLSLPYIVLHVALLIAAVLLHEFGHRITASFVGGTHDDMMLWPAGGMIPATCPPTPLATFITHIGGIAMNLLLATVCYIIVGLLQRQFPIPSFNPFALLGPSLAEPTITLNSLLRLFAGLNLGVAFIAAFPYYWFDGAHLLQAILWPFTGLRNATNVTCIVGMVLAVPLFILSVMAMNLFGMIFWALLFADSYRRRKDLKLSGLEQEMAYSNALSATNRPRRKRQSPLRKFLEKRSADKTQHLEQKVDEILAKVAQNGMHSLSESEKRTLERASRELRDRRP